MEKNKSGYECGLSVDKWVCLTTAFQEDGRNIPLHFCVTGHSMYPLLRSGKDRVTVYSCSGQLKRGDIVLFKMRTSGSSYVLHRVYKVKDDKVMTFGDGNLTPDLWLPVPCILGVVVKIERGAWVIRPRNFFWNLLGRLWMFLYPIRPLLFKIMRMVQVLPKTQLTGKE